MICFLLLHWLPLGFATIDIAIAFQLRLPSLTYYDARASASGAGSRSDKSPGIIPPYTKLAYSPITFGSGAIDISESAPRDISSLTEWATNYGAQTSDCFQLTNTMDESNALNNDVYATTNQDLPADSPILYIPNDLILTGNKAREEFGGDDATYQAEEILMNSEASGRLSQFYLFLKVLKEYECGQDSSWVSWLNALPRYYSNGASMTDFCEYDTYILIISAAKYCSCEFFSSSSAAPFHSMKKALAVSHHLRPSLP